MPSQLTTYQILTFCSLALYLRADKMNTCKLRIRYKHIFSHHFFFSSIPFYFAFSHHAIKLKMVFNRKRNLFFNRNACIGQVSSKPFQIYSEFRIIECFPVPSVCSVKFSGNHVDRSVFQFTS